jgi:hypothetical protein
LSIAAAFIVATGAFFVPREAALFALTGDRFFFPAVVGLGFLAALRLREGLRAGFFEALLRPFLFFVAIFTCPLCVRRA